MSKQPYVYRTMRWRWIIINIAFWALVLICMNVYASGTVGLVIVPFMALVFGWQMGTLSERNEWHEWYDIKNIDSEKTDP